MLYDQTLQIPWSDRPRVTSGGETRTHHGGKSETRFLRICANGSKGPRLQRKIGSGREEVVGRRPLALWGLWMMCAGLGVLMLAFSVQGSAVHPRGLTTSLPRRLGNVSPPRFVCALPGAPPARHDFRALPAGRAAGRLRVVGGELVVELAGGAVLSRAACVAVHTPRRTWEHGDDLRWVRGVLLTWVRFSVVNVARNQGNLTGESRSSAGHRAHCVLLSPASPTSVDEEASALRSKSHRAWCHRIGRRRQLPACEIVVQLYPDCVSAVAVQQLATCLSSWRSRCDTEV